MRRLACLLLLLMAAPSWSQKVVLPAEVKTAPNTWTVIVPDSKDGGEVKWKLGPGLMQADLSKLFPGQKAAGVVVYGPAGQYKVWAWCAKGDVASDLAECLVTVGDVPPGPVPPGPTPPGPTPPGPTPGPAPIPAAGLHVLVIYETAELSKLPAAQSAILYSQQVRGYLNAKCPAGPDGKTKEWRLWDKDVTTDGESKLWQDAMARPRSSVPWVIVSNPAKGGGYEGALPKDTAEMMILLKKWGGE